VSEEVNIFKPRPTPSLNAMAYTSSYCYSYKLMDLLSFYYAYLSTKYHVTSRHVFLKLEAVAVDANAIIW